MTARDVWRDPDGNPLKYQDGDYVRIDISSNPARASGLPFLEGYVRGYNLMGVDGGYEAAYELFRVGANPLRWVREEFLSKTSELLPHEHRGGFCGLCGHGGTPQGLSIFAGPEA
ncbi:hypothetical protein ACFW2V_13550 [Streptomyces sp. NPDC058947]|uniref:hypothetical protein n=1 Tax=Streptomyces sp. NPDC058947 TaxID=3346675 RepID=UPI003674BF38